MCWDAEQVTGREKMKLVLNEHPVCRGFVTWHVFLSLSIVYPVENGIY